MSINDEIDSDKEITEQPDYWVSEQYGKIHIVRGCEGEPGNGYKWNAVFFASNKPLEAFVKECEDLLSSHEEFTASSLVSEHFLNKEELKASGERTPVDEGFITELEKRGMSFKYWGGHETDGRYILEAARHCRTFNAVRSNWKDEIESLQEFVKTMSEQESIVRSFLGTKRDGEPLSVGVLKYAEDVLNADKTLDAALVETLTGALNDFVAIANKLSVVHKYAVSCESKDSDEVTIPKFLGITVKDFRVLRGLAESRSNIIGLHKSSKQEG